MSGPLLYGMVVAISFLTPHLKAATQVKLRGTVLDKTSRKPIARATVTASGNQSKQDEVTDDKGFFRLVLEGSAPGSLVRIRVQKDGYTPYDEQMVVSEEKPIEILMPPAHVAAPSKEISPVAAHFIDRLKSPDWRIRANAIESLSKITPLSSPVATAIAGGLLDTDLDVQLQAIWAVRRLKLTSKETVTNLIIGLSNADDTQRGRGFRELAARALGEIGSAARPAIPALLMSLSDPNRSIQQEVSAAISLLHLGVSDPKVDESLVRYADSSEAARGALREMGPKAARFVPDLIGKLRVALQSRQQVDAHFGIVSLLEAIGPAGETALVELMRSLTVSGQTRLAMAWVEAKPAARPEILRAMKVDEVGDLLAKELASHEQDTLGISEGPAFLGVPDGVSLRAAAGILLLGLEPREQAWKVMLGALATENPLSLRLDYATFMVGEIDPTMARPAIPALVKLLGRVSGDGQLRLIRAIGRIGDQTAVAPLESMARDADSELTREAAKRALAAIQSRL